MDPLAEYGVPQSWWRWLGTATLAGALGLLIGLVPPLVGVVRRRRPLEIGYRLRGVVAEITRQEWLASTPE